MYGIRLPTSAARTRIARTYSAELASWRKDLSYLLDTHKIDSYLFVPLFLRQRNVLNLAFWHAQILVHRPFLLKTFATLTNYGTRSSNGVDESHVVQCLEAAMNIVSLVDELHRTGQIYSTFWVSEICDGKEGKPLLTNYSLRITSRSVQ
jgi:hypothetical protein